MFEGLGDLLSAWRTIAQISEWTGLSVGALAALAGAVYLDPRLLKPALIGAGVLAIAYVSTLHGDAVGRADVEAQWADARKAAITAEQERDALVEQQLAAKFNPQLAALAKQAADNKDQADAYERKILALLASAPAAGACQLGDAADRLREQ